MKNVGIYLKSWLENCKKIDIFFLQLTCGLFICGLIFAFSSSVYESFRMYNNFYILGLKQLVAFFIGLLLLFFFSVFDYKSLLKYTWIYAFFVLFLILLMLFTPLGVIINGSRRWIGFGFFQIQPAELAKPAIILLTAMFVLKYKWFHFKKYYYFLFMSFLILLVLKQPDLGSAFILALTMIIMLFLFGYPVWIILPSSFLGVILVCIKVMSTNYQMNRINFWLHPELDPQGQGYNLIQAKYAYALGGILGSGFGHSIQKEPGHLPIPHADFIFAVISEEMGFLGASAILILFLAWILTAIKLVNQVKDPYGRIIGSGIIFLLSFQTVINLSVATGIMPVTGVTLPFFSCGGTSLIVSLAMIGILFNILSLNRKNEK